MMYRLISFVAIAIFAQQTFAASDPIEVLHVYAGDWINNIEHFDTRFSRARTEHTRLKNDCWGGGSFYICRQVVDGDEKALIVFTYDKKNGFYRSFPIQPGSEKAGSGTLFIAGNVWTFPWDDEDDGRQVHFRITNTFTDAAHIEYRQEYSLDRVNWFIMARGLESKID